MEKKKNKKANISLGSDHFIHVHILDLIRNNNFKYKITKISCYNEKHSAYPILFHYFLARFFYSTAKENPAKINFFISLLSQFFFNGFLFIYFENIEWLFLVKANIIFLAFPFTYVFWNAKNRGLSARGIGLLLGQIYLYQLVIYALTNNILTLLPITVTVLLILMASQFSFQFIILISLFICVITLNFTPLLPILLSIILFYFFFPICLQRIFYWAILS